MCVDIYIERERYNKMSYLGPRHGTLIKTVLLGKRQAGRSKKYKKERYITKCKSSGSRGFAGPPFV